MDRPLEVKGFPCSPAALALLRTVSEREGAAVSPSSSDAMSSVVVGASERRAARGAARAVGNIRVCHHTVTSLPYKSPIWRTIKVVKIPFEIAEEELRSVRRACATTDFTHVAREATEGSVRDPVRTATAG
eukprot:6172751-Pleurochrysis_carterae.AAC.2